MLSRYARRDGEGYRLRDLSPESEPTAALVLRLFGVDPGHSPSIADGLNELMSALAAAHCLGELLSPKHVAQVVCCIEGTIPFRLPDAQGRSCFDELARRLAGASGEFALGCSPDAVDDTVELAIDVANRDVGNFAEADTGRFLSYTWQLLPESHPPLRAPGRYTVREYREAVAKTEEFLSGLSPEAVFHDHRRPGREQEVAEKRTRARHNLRVASQYLRANLVAVAILEAIAEGTGGDAAVALFMGDTAQVGGSGPRFEHFVPPTPPGDVAPDCDPQVLRLLEVGRAEPSSFDLKESPLSTLVYRYLGEAGIVRGLELARAMFRGEMPPAELLEAMDCRVVTRIAAATAHLALTRSAELNALAQRLECAH
jgi:hypothetical protein